jgi:exodeoxyribonuclease-3
VRIATYNVNGIRSRLGNLLAWLERERPDVACLQELKAPDESFPIEAIRAAGYDAIWHGQKSWNGVAILARGMKPVESRRGLPRDPDDTHSRYLEAAVDGVLVGCLYLPNGNPQPGPKFDYKLKWFERLIRYAKALQASEHPVVLCGDYNVVPTDFDIYNPKSWRHDALLQPESREAYARLLAQGWTDALRHLHPDERIYTFWDYFRQHWQRNSGLRIDHLLLNPALAPRLRAAGVDTWVRGEPGASDHAPTWIELADAPAARAGKAAVKKVAVKNVAVKKVAVRKVATKKAATKGSAAAAKKAGAPKVVAKKPAAPKRATKPTATTGAAAKKRAAAPRKRATR